MDAITGIKILAILGLAGAGMYFSGTYASANTGPSAMPTASAYGIALIAAFWTFDGWSSLGFVAGEVKNPRRNIPLGPGLGIAALTTLYIWPILPTSSF